MTIMVTAIAIIVAIIITAILCRRQTAREIENALVRERLTKEQEAAIIAAGRDNRSYEEIVQDFAEIQQSLDSLKEKSIQKVEDLESHKKIIETKIAHASGQAEKAIRTSANLYALLNGELVTK